MAAAQRRQELAHEDPGTQGVSEGELRASLASMVQAGGDRAPFHQVFQPQEVANLLLEARGDDVCIIDVRHRCPFTDYMVLATARSQRLVHMLAAAVLHELKGRCREVAPGVAPGVEGLQVREGGGRHPPPPAAAAVCFGGDRTSTLAVATVSCWRHPCCCCWAVAPLADVADDVAAPGMWLASSSA